MRQKKRKAERVYEDDPEGEILLPTRKTKEIAESHLLEAKGKVVKGPHGLRDVGGNEDGKALFDYVLNGMSKPENKK
ncbi:hypothetical protein HDC90_004789 [Pedobacter sp. AK013]|uniref:hypothetical protein n=1 Tax=Pedobacter sp. AK013 TaxID=2723071 RepID=UPI00161B16E9|nr:hypothetical protein [Pedobacter sp. AK013]MBB6240125.1 hypothetical protein [Pedobacter sp. AK013]